LKAIPGHAEKQTTATIRQLIDNVVRGTRGLSNDEIAAAMTISPYTAEPHVSRAMTRLAARDRARLVVHAYETGLVAPRGRNPRPSAITARFR
jgi:DNA-binding NarL/FixJ family response regulator